MNFTPIIYADRSEGIVWWDNQWVSLSEFRKELLGKQKDEEKIPVLIISA